MNVRILAICLITALSLALNSFAQTNTNSASTNAMSSRVRCTTPAPRTGKAYDRYLALQERVKTEGKDAQLLFVGDSITQGWEGSGKNVWAKYYGHRHALDIGDSGDKTEHVLWRLEHGNIEGVHPKVAVLLIGVNNVPDESNSPGDILAGIKAIVAKLRGEMPEAKVLVLGIFPFREDFNPQRGRALQINQALHHIADNKEVFFLDFGDRFVTAEGKIQKSIMPDFLHPSEAGYKIWAEAMEPILSKLLGDEPVKP